MIPQTTTNSTRSAPRRRFRVVLILILLTLAVVFVGQLGYRYWQRMGPEPPVVDAQKLDPFIKLAIDDARTKLVSNRRSAGAWGRYGTVLLAHDFHRQAVEAFAEAERLDTRDPRWPYFAAIAMEETDSEQLLRHLTRTLELTGDEMPAPRLRLVDALVRRGELDEAERHARRVVEKYPTDARALHVLGQIMLSKRNPQEAQTLFKRALDAHPNHKLAHIGLANAYQQLRQPDEAQKQLAIASGLEDVRVPPDPLAEEINAARVGLSSWLSRVELVIERRDLNLAVQLLQALTNDYPDSVRAWLKLGMVYQMQNRLDQSEHALRTAVKLAPGDADAHLLLAYTLLKKSNLREADIHARRATEISPRLAEARFCYGHVLQLQGKHKDAIEQLQMALRDSPRWPDAQLALAQSLHEAGDKQQAIKMIDEVLDQHPAHQQATTMKRLFTQQTR